MSNKDLNEVRGGAKWGIAAIIASGIAFIIGIFDGYQRPVPCSK